MRLNHRTDYAPKYLPVSPACLHFIPTNRRKNMLTGSSVCNLTHNHITRKKINSISKTLGAVLCSTTCDLQNLESDCKVHPDQFIRLLTVSGHFETPLRPRTCLVRTECKQDGTGPYVCHVPTNRLCCQKLRHRVPGIDTPLFASG